jgi:hypothetical protein
MYQELYLKWLSFGFSTAAADELAVLGQQQLEYYLQSKK